MNKLHILTLSWQGKDKLEKLYKSLIPALHGVDYHWHIKSNGCTDGSMEAIEAWNNDRIHGIKYPHNLDSFSQGTNFLFKESGAKDTDYILLLNNDIVINDNASVKKMMFLLDNPEVGVVGAKLKYNDTKTIQHAGVIFNHRKLPGHFGAGQTDNFNLSKDREFQAVTGAVKMMRAQDFQTIGMLNEKLVWSFEDIYCSLQIKYELKKKIVCCGSTNIFHEESASLKKNPVNKLFLTQNARILLQRWQKEIVTDIEDYKNLNHNIFNA